MNQLNNYTPLSFEELNKMNGGESIWYWIAYGAGWVARGIKDDIDRMSQPGSYQWDPARPYG